ncbi:MAG: hypothetical protein KGO02_01110 [Alphaproteobacteria bacterium]|nr:hypothetical protein [Alphaproteobacteria bacterium]
MKHVDRHRHLAQSHDGHGKVAGARPLSPCTGHQDMQDMLCGVFCASDSVDAVIARSGKPEDSVPQGRFSVSQQARDE